MAQLSEDTPVPCVDHSSSSNLQGDVETLEAVARDGGGQLLVSLSLPVLRRRHVSRGVPRDGQLNQLHLLGLAVDDDQVRLLGSHCHIGGDGDAVHSVTLYVGKHLDAFQPLGREESVEIFHDVVVSPLKPIQSFFAVAHHVDRVPA